MGTETPIEWTDATHNVVGGCSIESPGCTNCYAQQLAGTRLKNHPLYKDTTNPSKAGPVFNGHLTVLPPSHAAWTWPGRWKGADKPVMGTGKPSLIFLGDMSDLFLPTRQSEDIDRAFHMMGLADDCGRSHIFQLLTKHPDRMATYMQTRAHKVWNGPRMNRGCTPRNLWFGFSAERQKEFDERWPHARQLAEHPEAIIFVSYEPAVGPLVLPPDFLALGARAQVILGGESGRKARPADIAWFRPVIQQCRDHGVAAFVKQLGVTPYFGECGAGWAAPFFHKAKPHWRMDYLLPDGQLSVAEINNRKGGDIEEWPLDYRVRQFPRRPSEA